MAQAIFRSSPLVSFSLPARVPQHSPATMLKLVTFAVVVVAAASEIVAAQENVTATLVKGGSGSGGPTVLSATLSTLGSSSLRGGVFGSNSNLTASMINSTAFAAAGGYQINVDYPGGDISPCGYYGCIMNADDTHLDCATLCRVTRGCVGYVWAGASCSGKSGPICWTKGSWGGATSRQCRNSFH